MGGLMTYQNSAKCLKKVTNAIETEQQIEILIMGLKD